MKLQAFPAYRLHKSDLLEFLQKLFPGQDFNLQVCIAMVVYSFAADTSSQLIGDNYQFETPRDLTHVCLSYVSVPASKLNDAQKERQAIAELKPDT